MFCLSAQASESEWVEASEDEDGDEDEDEDDSEDECNSDSNVDESSDDDDDKEVHLLTCSAIDGLFLLFQSIDAQHSFTLQ